MSWRLLAGLILLTISLMPTPARAQQQTQMVKGTVVQILERGETTVGPVTQPYQRLSVRLTTGDRVGELVTVDIGIIDLNTANQQFEPGDTVFLAHTPAAGPGQFEHFVLIDRARGTPLALLAALFAFFIVLTSRWKGVRSLIGMAFTFAVIVWFLIPRLLNGGSPVGTSIAAAFAIFTVTLFLVHGIGRMTVAAMAGTSLSLLITGGLASIFVDISHLTGLASEEAALLQASIGGRGLNPQGLLLGGIIIGALGVLDDVTVTQSSTVFELRKANPNLSVSRLFRSGLKVGRDHIATTVNTLVLAYVGASLPLMLLFTQSDQPFLQIVNREIVAEEIVRTLVGTLGLISAVPLTTSIASWLAVRTPPERIDDHGHSHGRHDPVAVSGHRRHDFPANLPGRVPDRDDPSGDPETGTSSLP
ncbi:YibE/F family protein [Nitrolancea hollandica]|uniref:Putative membrane protein n=1 Tax=Nitrolancea hollandica Lb TaxID=1129897 RepID=I4EN26_9BACT|nr:YibE/F family protein [Nitrolancea hollandica]CCF86089.1 putative membrane protein [Nitrolancea hollandica Lb]